MAGAGRGRRAWTDPGTVEAKEAAGESGGHGTLSPDQRLRVSDDAPATRRPDLSRAPRGAPSPSFSKMCEEEESVPHGRSRGTAERASLSAGRALSVQGSVSAEELAGAGTARGRGSWSGHRRPAKA